MNCVLFYHNQLILILKIVNLYYLSLFTHDGFSRRLLIKQSLHTHPEDVVQGITTNPFGLDKLGIF